MKKILFVLSLLILLGSGFCGTSLMNTMAEEPATPETISYYKSIEIERGDTLWGIAEEYSPQTDLTVSEYVHLLKQMNHLGEDTIHEGCHLVVMYQSIEEI